MSTLKTTNLQHASAASAAITLASDGTAAATLSSVNGGPLSGTRNRIINGDMRIDQRNAGASVTQDTTGVYPVDRWLAYGTVASKFTAQRNAGSVTPPAGFTNYLGCTSSSAYTAGASEGFTVSQHIEGFNVADLGWGAAGARSVTLSFWVRSSLTGTFGGTLQNSAQNRSYAFTYSISASNTWEQKTVVVSGDTSGTWLKDNGLGLRVIFGLGAGSSWSGTAGSWSGSFFITATGATSVVGTNGATFYITGVQLEAGSVATPFEHRSYGQELALCQRYFWKNGGYATYPFVASGVATAATLCELYVAFPVEMRAQPDADRSGLRIRAGTSSSAVTGIASNYASRLSTDISFTVASGLTANNAVCAQINGSATDYLSFSAEL